MMNQIKVERIVVHQINHHHYNHPLLSAQELTITEEINYIFTDLLIQNLEHRFLRVGKFHENHDSPISLRDLSDRILDEPAHFVSYSQSIAQYLFYTVADSKTVAPTDLAICTFSEIENPIKQLALLMMYPMDAFMFLKEITNGQLLYNLKKVSGILSTGKLQKCAFILPKELRKIYGYDLKVLDRQVGADVASYFINFLQCSLLEPARKVNMKPKFFISYSSKDGIVAEEISAILQESGFNTWLDKKDIVIGQPILDRVSKGIETESDFVIILISKNSTNSEWCKLELRMAYQKELGLKRTVVLPIRIDDAEVPAEIMTKKYYQFIPHNKTSASSLVREIKSLLKLQG